MIVDIDIQRRFLAHAKACRVSGILLDLVLSDIVADMRATLGWTNRRSLARSSPNDVIHRPSDECDFDASREYEHDIAEAVRFVH